MLGLITLLAASMLGMLLPYLPGRYDGAAATLSYVIQIASFASLLLVPVGLAWMLFPRRSTVWRPVALSVAGIIVLASTISAAAVEHLSMGLVLGAVGGGLIWARRRQTVEPDVDHDKPNRIALWLVVTPLLLVAFRLTILPRAAAWSRDRAIDHASALISDIEVFAQRRGRYPISLHSLNADFHTGVIGIDRFHYEPNGDGYNLYFVRPSTALDAWEVVMYNPRDEHRFTSHVLDILQYDGIALDQRRGDRRRTRLSQPHWISILFD